MFYYLKKLPKTAYAVFGLSMVFRWQLLQLVAWSWMLVSNSFHHGLAKAWEMTFSGNFPCPLCRLVASGSSMEAVFWSQAMQHTALYAFPVALLLTAVSALLLKRWASPSFVFVKITDK